MVILVQFAFIRAEKGIFKWAVTSISSSLSLFKSLEKYNSEKSKMCNVNLQCYKICVWIIYICLVFNILFCKYPKKVKNNMVKTCCYKDNAFNSCQIVMSANKTKIAALILIFRYILICLLRDN